MPEPINDHRVLFEDLIPKCPSGPIIEFGVYEGGSTEQLAKFGRTVYALDTFRGLPKEEYLDFLDNANPPGKFCPVVIPLVPGVVIVAGRFKETLPTLGDLHVAFAYLDCDYYESYLQAFDWLDTHLLPGGYLVTDDYGWCVGATKAIDEWRHMHPDWNYDYRTQIARRPCTS